MAKAPGVTDDSIKLGISYVDLKAIADVTKIDHGDYEASFNAVIDDLNDRGGINGRTIEPVFAPINPIGTEGAEEACLKLTEDDQVFAITGFFLGDAVLCPLENHDTAVVGGEMNAERLGRVTAPWFTLEPGSDIQSDVVRLFADEKLLDGKLAVFAQSIDADLMNNTILPLLDELGIEPVSTAILDAPADDINAGLAQTGVIAQKFESAGATKVLVVGNGGVAWSQGTEPTDYRPENLFITTNTILAYTGDAAGRDLSVLDGALAGDLYGPKKKQYEEPGMQKCLGVLEEAGVEVEDPDTVEEGEADGTAAFTACRYMALFEALVQEGRQGPQLRHLPGGRRGPRGQDPRRPRPVHVRQPARTPTATRRCTCTSGTAPTRTSWPPRADTIDRMEVARMELTPSWHAARDAGRPGRSSWVRPGRSRPTPSWRTARAGSPGPCAAAGVGAGDHVAILMENNGPFLEVALGGAALGPALHRRSTATCAPAEVQYVLDDCGAVALVSSAAMAGRRRRPRPRARRGARVGGRRPPRVRALRRRARRRGARPARRRAGGPGDALLVGHHRPARRACASRSRARRSAIRRRRRSRSRRSCARTASARAPSTSRPRRSTTPRRSCTPCRCTASAPRSW